MFHLVLTPIIEVISSQIAKNKSQLARNYQNYKYAKGDNY